MSRKSLLYLSLLVIVPIAIFAWLGWRVARVEQVRVEQQYRALIQERLSEENQRLGRYFDEVRRRLARLVDASGDRPEDLRQLVRGEPLLRQILVLDRRGELIHPPLTERISDDEREFLVEIEQLLKDKDLIRLAFPVATGKPVSARLPAQSTFAGSGASVASPDENSAATGPVPSDGWLVWYWGRGINLMYWRRQGPDRVAVLALARARWVSDLVASLPETRIAQAGRGSLPVASRVSLVDAGDQVIYQWGTLTDEDPWDAVAETPVVAPLSAWRLKYDVDRRRRLSVSQFPIIAGLLGTTFGLLGLVVVFYREHTRELREAQRRVNFVNQVSHELKTPLTNIRMYADLLGIDLEQVPELEATKPRQRLSVIVQESQRLSRLITNVLTFARAERRQLELRRQDASLDELIRRVTDRFRPALEAAGIRIELELTCAGTIGLDVDLVEQMLGNLLSNVERYAASGEWLRITSRREDHQAVVTVEDRGPGIPPGLRERIFEAFFRASDRLSDAAGTGIGLSIARRIARLHGGEITVQESALGAVFQVVLPTA